MKIGMMLNIPFYKSDKNPYMWYFRLKKRILNPVNHEEKATLSAYRNHKWLFVC